VFPTLLALGGQIELRSNWRVYVEEFALALARHGWLFDVAPVTGSGDPVTPFERKYRDSGHPLWRLEAHEGPAGAPVGTYSSGDYVSQPG
jgi:tRNA G46 methylase TrmB